MPTEPVSSRQAGLDARDKTHCALTGRPVRPRGAVERLAAAKNRPDSERNDFQESPPQLLTFPGCAV